MLFFLESHAFQCRAAARLSPSASQGALCCHSQGAHTGSKGGKRWGRTGGVTANSMNPPGALAVSATLPPFPLASFLLPLVFLFSVLLPVPPSLFLALSLTKLDPGPTGPDPRTGLSQLAYQELPQGSPDTVIESERRKQGDNSP